MTHDELIEATARAIAPHMEGGREFDQMPPDKVALRKWHRENMCGGNDATQDDALDAARAAISVIAPAVLDQAANRITADTASLDRLRKVGVQLAYTLGCIANGDWHDMTAEDARREAQAALDEWETNHDHP